MTAPVFRVGLNGDVEIGDTVELLLGGVSFTTPLLATMNGADLANGYVEFTVTDGDLGADGAKLVSALLTDAVGNSSLAATTAITLDTTAPAAPAPPDLTAASDTGSSSTDDITGDSTPDFSGSAAPGSTVELFVNDVSIGTTLADGTTGNWILVWATDSTSAALADGIYDITATATDAAGNASPASAALPITIVSGSTITGTPGDDTLNGTGANDLIEGLAGNDTLDGNAGNDVLVGGSGADILFGDLGADILFGGIGVDILIPACTDQNPCAHSRMPIEMIFHGRSISLFQASQQSATMSS